MQQPEISAFDFKNLPDFINVVKDMWSPAAGTGNFKKLYVEMVLRSNIHENAFQYQLEDDSPESPYAAAFFMKKGDESRCEEWLNEQKKNLSEEEKKVLDTGFEYLEFMDRKTLSMMNDDDIKLCLFISRKKGCGSKLLDQLKNQFKNLGYKRLFLWTDCECSWEWYEKNGYTLLCRENYEKYTTAERTYSYYIFCCDL